MEANERAALIFDKAKQTGLVNPITGDGMPTLGMVVDAIQTAEDNKASEIDRLKMVCQSAHDRLLRGDTDCELLEILEGAWKG